MDRKVKREFPVTFETPSWIHDEFRGGSVPSSESRTELICPILLGFFFLLRISAIERLTWKNIVLGTDVERANNQTRNRPQ